MSTSSAATAALLLAATAAPALAQDGKRLDEAERIELRTQHLYEAHRPSVMSVRVTTRAHSTPRLVFPGLQVSMPGSVPEQVDGTGFLLSQDGFVVTTYDAIRNAAHVEIRFSDGKLYDAALVGADEPFQMAVLRTAHNDAEPLAWPGSVSADRGTVGWFFQAGNDEIPDVQLAPVRVAKKPLESYDRYLYSAMPLAAGAAGGPLLGDNGRLLGMAVGAIHLRAKKKKQQKRADRRRLQSATLFVQGEDVFHAARDIVRYGKVRRPMLGVVLERETNRIDQLLPGGPAERAGLAEGDRVVGLAGQRVGDLVDVTRTLLRSRPGDRVEVALERDGQRVLRQVTLSEHGLPPLPDTAPLPGAMLELIVPPVGADGRQPERQVVFLSVTPGTALHFAGVLPGDELVDVDGLAPVRFLARHRIRPATNPPRRIEIERDGQRIPIDLE